MNSGSKGVWLCLVFLCAPIMSMENEIAALFNSYYYLTTAEAQDNNVRQIKIEEFLKANPQFRDVRDVFFMSCQLLLEEGQFKASELLKNTPIIFSALFLSNVKEWSYLLEHINPNDFRTYRLGIIEQIYSVLKTYAFCKGNPFSEERLLPLLERNVEWLLGAYTAHDLSMRINVFLRLNGYEMSHLYVKYDARSYTQPGDEKSNPSSYDISIAHLLPDKKTFFIAFNKFTNHSENELTQALLHCFKEQHNIIIDMRNNVGGLGTALNSILSLFFDPQKFAVTADRETVALACDNNLSVDYNNHYVFFAEMGRVKEEDVFSVFFDNSLKSYLGRIALLVGCRTSSAAEILAYVLQKSNKATIIGQTTAGAVLAARTFSLNCGLKITCPIGDVIFYDGTTLEKNGVQPDIEVNENMSWQHALHGWIQSASL
ncbi:MAG: S41 family peptidase [Myxococcales bacterium]|nr:MAG: S41 family peptidase [Myxococcales bacterium]